MTKSYAGGCACGAVRYKIDSQPVFQNHCQCRDCQLRSGAGHGSYLTFAGRDEVSVTGEASTWRVTAESGNDKIHAFCPRCGTPVYLTFIAMPELFSVAAGSLDEPDRFKPQAVTYAGRGHDWDRMDPALPAFERMPG
ncbi:MAG: GFA family protein [Hoeflea sp.]|uniref:GFA family protein n=1 Tax=Hoeflea sp. TaxID=1940281 RepID=UPI0032EDE20B